jgi:transketolase
VPEIYSSRPDLKVGNVKVLKEGTDVAIIACGVMVNEALEAGESLAKEKISAEVIDCHTLKPLDADTIVSVARKTGGIVTAEEQSIIGGLGSAVAEATSSSYPVPISMVGVRDTFGESGEYKELMAKYGLTSKDIVRAAKKLVASR